MGPSVISPVASTVRVLDAAASPRSTPCDTGSFRLFSTSPLAFIWDNFASAEECAALVRAGSSLRERISGPSSDPDLVATLTVSGGMAYGVPYAYDHGDGRRGDEDEERTQTGKELPSSGVASGVFKRVYCLPGSRKLRAEFEVPEATVDSHDLLIERTLRRFRSVVAEFVGQAPHDGEDECVLNCTPGREEAGKKLLECGLHVDTHNDAERRFATAILYLNTLGGSEEEGGETVFPCAKGGAGPDDLVEDHIDHSLNLGVRGRRLLGEKLLNHFGVESTELSEDDLMQATKRSAGEGAAGTPVGGHVSDELERCAAELDASAGQLLLQHRRHRRLIKTASGARTTDQSGCCGNTYCVRPRTGALLLFGVRGANGGVDPAAWHGSATVFPETATKWTLQTFKAMPESDAGHDHGGGEGRPEKSDAGHDHGGGEGSEDVIGRFAADKIQRMIRLAGLPPAGGVDCPQRGG